MRKIIIISDNDHYKSLLLDYLKTGSGMLIAGVFSTPGEAQPTLDEIKCDVLFASLPVLSSPAIEQKEIPVLVCLGEEKDMAPSASTRNIFAWLHLPFSYERVLSLIQNIELYMLQLSARTEERRDYVFIKSEYKLIKINLSDILYLSGLRDYTQVFLKGRVSPLTTLQNLKDFEHKLPDNNFVRVHRSYIVSLGQVDSISRSEIMIGQHVIPIGNAYRQMLDDMINPHHPSTF
jgi:DNA-binding LytR/AlgR family response regulator